MELLAPAGSYEALIMAVRCGADAVYLGGTSFNARASAANFNKEKLAEAIDYCHTHNVKTYITLNTLLYDDELRMAYDDACEMSNMGADAFIIQDIGLLSMLSANTDFELHASTQMSIHNVDGVNAALKLGCKRVVLARETPLFDIKKIKEETKAQIEVFIHGALCIGFSGQCLFSSLAGGRSGNRGKCAQACRLPYGILNNGKQCGKGYLLSPKDLCTISYLEQLCDIEVDSLKIEGRLKRPEYVGVVTKQYREALNLIKSRQQYSSDEYMKELASVFNRGGFTRGYYLGADDIIYSQSPNNTGVRVGRVLSDDGRHIFADVKITKGDGVEIRKNGLGVGGGAIYDIVKDGNKVNFADGNISINSLASGCKGAHIYRTTDKNQIDAINSFASKEVPLIGLDAFLRQSADNIMLRLTDGDDSVEVLRQYSFVEGGTKQSDIISSLSKFGGTQYYIKNVNTVVLPGGYIPQGMINSMRREAKEMIDSLKINKYKNKCNCKNFDDIVTDKPVRSVEKPVKSIFAYDIKQLKGLCADKRYARVYYKPLDYTADIELPIDRVNEVYFVPFDISFDDDMELYNFAGLFDGIYAENLFAVELANKLNKKCIAGLGLNVLNSATAAVLNKMGCAAVTVSCEATAKQINAIAATCDAEVVALGRLPMMKFVQCPAEAQGLCRECNGGFALQDRLGNIFDLVKFKTHTCKNVLLNSVNIDLVEEIRKLGISECNLNNAAVNGETTKGHYKRGV